MAQPPADKISMLLAEMADQLEAARALAVRLDARPMVDEYEIIRQIEAAARTARAAISANAAPHPDPGSPASISSQPPSD